MTTLSAKSVPRSLVSSLVAVQPDLRATHSATHITEVLGLRLERTVVFCTPLFSSSIALVCISPQPLAARLAPQVTVPCHSRLIRVVDVRLLEMAIRLSLNLLRCPPLRRAPSTISPYLHHLTGKSTLRHPPHVTSPPQLALRQDAFQRVNTSPAAYFRVRDLCHHFIPIIRCKQRMLNGSGALI